MKFRLSLRVLAAAAVLITGSAFGQSPAQKLQSIRIPSIEFSEAALHEAVTFLQARSAELSGSPNGGVNFILNAGEEVRNSPVSMKLQNVSLGQAVWFLSGIARLEIKIDQHAVMLQKAEKWERRPVTTSVADRAVSQKLNRIIVPGVELSSVPVSDLVQLLRDYSVQLDAEEPDPAKRGINFVLYPGQGMNKEPEITFSLNQVPLSQVLRYGAELAGYDTWIEKGAVVLAPPVVSTLPVPLKE